MEVAEENVDEQSTNKSKNIKKILLLVFGVIFTAVIVFAFVFPVDNWHSSVDESKMIEFAKDKIEERFSGAASISYRYGDVEYKDEDFDNLYYFMFYTVTATVTNQFNAQTKYFCTVKIYFEKETMKYTVCAPSCNKIMD